MIYIIDTYAWVEYFIGSSKGIILRQLFNNKNNKFITLECCLAELRAYCLREKRDFEQLLDIVRHNSIILPVMKKQWLEAGKIRFELREKIPHFGLIDALLVSKQIELKSKIVSGDPHFKSIKNVVYLGD